MDNPRGPTLSLRARGPLACFTRPELKVERVSYPVMTPSAARGLIEAILWKPAMAWHIERIKILNPIEYTSFRRNELNTRAKTPTKDTIENGGPAPDQFIEDDHTQRNTVALRDVDYVIDAYFTLTDQAGERDNIYKFIDIFSRRVEKGQHFHQPYLGCREFVAEILQADDAPEPIDESRDLGIMLWDIDYSGDGNTPLFFNAALEDGVLDVPKSPNATLEDALERKGDNE